MWIFLQDAFLSISAHEDRPDDLMVRGRVEGDIERVFPDASVEETPDADYRYRAAVPRDEVAQAVADRARGLEYFDFDDAVPDEDRVRQETYTSVWETMSEAQRAG